MKKLSKDAVGMFEVLIDHSVREYEPFSSHVLKRMIRPLCKELDLVLRQGTKNDAWEVVTGFSKACKKKYLIYDVYLCWLALYFPTYQN